MHAGVSPQTGESPCHVLHIRTFLHLGGVTDVVKAECETLPDNLVRELRGILEHGLTWVSQDSLRRTRARENLHGLVILSYPVQIDPVRVFPAITVPFEPTPLRETDHRFAQLVNAINAADVPFCIPRRPVRWKRLWVNSMLPIIGLLTLSLLFLLTLFNITVTGVGACALVALILWLRSRRSRWMVIPGGVFIASGTGEGEMAAAHVYTPKNTVLHMRRFGGAWDVKFDSEVPGRGCTLTDFEFNILLAAWQSPVSMADHLRTDIDS